MLKNAVKMIAFEKKYFLIDTQNCDKKDIFCEEIFSHECSNGDKKDSFFSHKSKIATKKIAFCEENFFMRKIFLTIALNSDEKIAF